MTRIERAATSAFTYRPGAYVFLKTFCPVRHRAIRADECRDSAVRHAHQVSIALNCAKHSIRQMLPHHRRRTEISVVRNINQHVGALVCEVTRDCRMRSLDTNKNPGAKRAEGHQRVRTAGRKFADDSTHRTSAR